MSGLFSVFNIANRGLAAQQKAINVTSHNIANANTEGYSRQRATMETTRPFGMPSLNNAVGPGQLGTGVQVSAIDRVRDSFLDYQVRVETSRYGQFSARDKFLKEVENIFNEPSDTGISTLIGKFFDSWNDLSLNPQSSNSRTIVAQQSAALADALNHTSNQLHKLEGNVDEVMGSTIFEVNDILAQVDQLNQQIIGVKVAGQMPNDLMDRRDLLLDKLSSKFNIKIVKSEFEGINVSLERSESDPLKDTADLIKAVGNNNESRFSYIDSIVKAQREDGTVETDEQGNVLYNIVYNKLGNTSSTAEQGKIKLALTAEQKEELLNNRIILADKDGTAVSIDGTQIDSYNKIALIKQNEQDTTGKYIGEIYGYISVKNDIDKYIDQLDKVAKALAFSVNAIHSGETDASMDTKKFFVNKDDLDKEEDITAANVSVNSPLLEHVMEINTKYDSTYGDTDGSRALAISELRNKLIYVSDIGVSINSRADMFDSSKGKNVIDDTAKGKVVFVSAPSGMKIDSYFKDVIGRLGVQEGEAKRMVTNQETLLSSFQQTRESISGVSIDEEMANLIQYQHAYQANAKIISTVDELLDVVINGLKR